MSAVLDVVVSVSKDGTVEINKVKRSADEAEKSTKNLTKSTERLSTSYVKMARNIALTVAGLYGVKKSVELVTSSVKDFTSTSAQFEQFETTLKSITGSSEKAKESMSWIQDFTAKTPFELNQVTEAFVKMKAYGLNPTDGTLRTLGDTASAMGKDINQAVEAMADAVTGENERLKEFGVKASVQGEKVAYSWSDSSGKMRNIVVENNKDVIQSTLNAIFNEKYVGAMDEQSKTWNGMLSNLSDRWTLFKKDIMDEGLFVYFKAILGVIGDTLGGAFTDAKNGAKSFSDSVIAGIESIILGIGNMSDLWNGAKFAFKSIEVAFFALVAGIGDGVNVIGRGWDAMTVSLHNGFKGFVDGTGKAFYSLINKLLDGINTLVNGASSGLGGLFEYIGVSNPFGTINLSVGEYTSSIETAKEKTEDLINTDWSNANLKRAVSEADGLLESLINEDGKKKALSIIDQIKSKVKELTTTETKNNKVKADAKKHLDAIGAGFGAMDKSSKKAGASAKKALRDAQRASEEAERALKDYNERFADSFAFAFDDILNGDIMGSFSNFFDSVSNTLVTPFIEDMSKQLSSSLSNLMGGLGSFGSFGAGLVVSGIGMLVDTFFGDSEEPAPVLGDIDAKTSDTLVNALENILDVQYPILEVSREMAGYLLTISKAFGGVENSLLRSGIDIGGDLFQDTFKKGTLFGGKSTSLYGTSIKVDSASMADLMDGEITAMLDTVTKTVSKKWYGAKRTYYNHKYTDISNDIGEYISEATTAIFNSLTLSGEALGINTSSLSSAKINLGKMDTTGMNAEEVASELQGRFSAQIDAITEKYFGAVGEFQRAGEGLGETLYRVVTNFEQVGHSLGLIDKSVDWRTANIIADVAGGLDKLGASMADYTQNFYSEQERNQMQIKTMTKNFESLGLAMPTDKEGFRALIDGLDTTTDEGATLFAELIGLSGAFAEMADASKKLKDEEKARLKELAEEEQNRLDAIAKAITEATEATKRSVSDIGKFLTGKYSFLTAQGKTDYANMMLEQSRGENPLISEVDASKLRLEQAYKTASTREEFDAISRQHLGVLVENAEKDATNADLLTELIAIREKMTELEETTRLKA